MARPTKYKPEFCKLAYRLSLLSATDKEISDILEVTEKTLNLWKIEYPEFLQSLKRGKEEADSRVVKRLFDRAMGYEHRDTYITQYQGKIIKEDIIKHYPPDTTACIFWLKNRQPDKWRDVQDISHKVELPQIIEMSAEEYLKAVNGNGVSSDN